MGPVLPIHNTNSFTILVVGFIVGLVVLRDEGRRVGVIVEGLRVGEPVILALGLTVGLLVGPRDGFGEGLRVGL